MKKFSLVISIFFVSCATSTMDVIQVGPWFAPVKKSKIEVFTDRNAVRKPFGAIAILHSERYFCSPKEDVKALNMAIDKAAKAGADAIVYSILSYDKDLNPDLPEECYLSGMAIKYVDKDKASNKKNVEENWSPI